MYFLVILRLEGNDYGLELFYIVLSCVFISPKPINYDREFDRGI